MNIFYATRRSGSALVEGLSFLALLATARPLLAQEAGEIPPISVIGSTPLTADSKIQSDATAAQGYRPDFYSSVGPLGAKPVLDTPYSIDVISRDLIENIQAGSTDDIFKVDPFTQNNYPVNRGNPFSVVMRGFTTGVTTLDNMRMGNAAIVDVEGLERVELVRGLSSFLYGPADPGGLINFVVKRPTAAPFAHLTVGDYGLGPDTGGAGYAHGDFGGLIDKEGQFAYRINIVGQDGNTAVDQQRLQRNYLSAALDWHISSDILAQINVFHSYYRTTSPDPYWYFGGSSLHPAAPSAQKSWSERWGYYRNEQDGGQAKFTWKPNEIFTLRTGFTYIQGSTSDTSINNSVSSNNGSYTQSAIVDASSKLTNLSGYGLADVVFDTGPLKHKLTGGYFTSYYQSMLPEDAAAFPSVNGSFSFAGPTYGLMPSAVVGTRSSSLYFTRGNQNFILGDEINYGPLSLIAGVTHAQIQTSDYTYLPATGTSRTLTAKYDTGQFTPSASLLYKVTPWLSAYATYIEGLEPGNSAPSYAANANAVLPPELDRQYEAGLKARLNDTLLTLAFFDINKAYAYLDPSDNNYKLAGREEHKGVEIGASGKVLPDLTIFGGVTFLDPRVTNDPTLDGMRPINVSSQMAKLYSEYSVPLVPGLTLTGGVYYYGKFAANAANTEYLPGYVTEDLGFRYETKINGVPVTGRFNVSNITNKSYWMSSYFVGEPRKMAFSLETRF